MRRVCEDFQQIDVRQMDFRRGTPWQYPPPNGIALSVMGDAIHVIHGAANFYVSIERTACNYGGSRLWFLCPRCGDRRAVLYGDGQSAFGCRRCMNLHYTCETEDTFDRRERKRRKLETKLNDSGGKPKWMRLATFEQLHFKRARAQADAVRWLVRKLPR
jgi:hypothetical protein